MKMSTSEVWRLIWSNINHIFWLLFKPNPFFCCNCCARFSSLRVHMYVFPISQIWSHKKVDPSKKGHADRRFHVSDPLGHWPNHMRVSAHLDSTFCSFQNNFWNMVLGLNPGQVFQSTSCKSSNLNPWDHVPSEVGMFRNVWTNKWSF